MSAPDIFLSYNREDQAVARRYAEAFAAQGFDVWWDSTLRAGEAYDEVTENALRSAKAVVVLWSKKSVVSRWVRAEATLADRNKTLVPCMIEPCERPIMFELTQTAELAHWQGAANDRAWLAFVADVKRFVEAGPTKTPAPAVIATLAEIAAAPAPAPETMLAVLPFDNLSNDSEMVFFSDGVSEDILGRLTRGSKLKVIGRTSSFQFRGADKSKAAAALKATHVLDGSIRRGGNKVRVAAHLTEAATQTTLWSDKYDRDLEDIFAVQDEISEAIAEALNAAFFPAKTAPIDPAIYDKYLRAREHSTDPNKMAESIALLESITHEAHDFADAWSTLARVRGQLHFMTPYAERPPMVALARSEIARSIALDPGNLEGHIAPGLFMDPFGAFLESDAMVRRVGALGENDAQAQFIQAMFAEGVGRGRAGLQYARRAYGLDPLVLPANQALGQGTWRAGQYAEGRAIMERLVSNWPDDHHTSAQLIMACAHQQDWAAVDALIDPARLARYPLREHVVLLALLPVWRNPTLENRRALFERMRSRVETTGHTEAQTCLLAAHFGFVDETFEMMEHAKFGPAGGRGDIMGINAYRTHLLFPAAYPELRADPRFVKLCARLGLVEYWLATQNWPDCAEVVPYDFKAECEKYRDYPKDKFFA